jgi:uncharacterized protein
MTGNAPDLEKVRKAKELAGDCPLLIGSGADENNVHLFLSVADGVIVGTSVKEGGVCENPVDPERVRRLVNAAAAEPDDAARFERASRRHTCSGRNEAPR